MNKNRSIWIILAVLVISNLLTWFDWEAEIPFSVIVSFLFIGIYTLFCLKEWVTWKQELVLNGVFGLTATLVFVLRYYASDLLSVAVAVFAGVFHPIAQTTVFLAKRGVWLPIILIVWFFALPVFRLVKEYSKKEDSETYKN